MAVWARFSSAYSWAEFSRIAKNYKLDIGESQDYNINSSGYNYIRMGFASHNTEEINKIIRSLKKYG